MKNKGAIGTEYFMNIGGLWLFNLPPSVGDGRPPFPLVFINYLLNNIDPKFNKCYLSMMYPLRTPSHH